MNILAKAGIQGRGTGFRVATCDLARNNGEKLLLSCLYRRYRHKLFLTQYLLQV